MIILFFVGILEMLIVTAWTKEVSETNVLISGAITFVNIIIWYYVLQTIVENMGDWRLVLVYTFGCVSGNMLTTYYYKLKGKKKSKKEKNFRNEVLEIKD